MAMVGVPDANAIPRLRQVLKLLDDVELLAEDASSYVESEAMESALQELRQQQASLKLSIERLEKLSKRSPWASPWPWVTLGLMYRKGDGVTQDDKEAVKWYRLAAAQENAIAQFNLGVAYYKGLGVTPDYKEAMRLYRLSAAQGYAIAQFNLGLMYDNGEGVIQDYTEAVRLYRMSAAQGIADAQFNLGWMYANGQGVIQDNVYAHMWFNIAAISGDADAVKSPQCVSPS